MAVIRYSLKPKKPKPLPTVVQFEFQERGEECPVDYTLGIFTSYRAAEGYRASLKDAECYDIVTIVSFRGEDE